MFRNKEVRNYCEQSMIYFDIIVPPYKKISATLNSFREIYNGFYRWSDTKLLAQLREKWRIIETIQNKHVEKLFEKNEDFKRKLENQSLLDKSKVEIIKKQKPTDKKVQVTPISSDIEDYNLIDKNKVDIIKNQDKQTKPKVKTTEETMDNYLYRDSDQEINIEQENVKIEKDPWLNENYVGKPLSVKSLRIRMNRGYNVNSTYHNEDMDRWVDDEQITHPYIAIKITQINPRSLQEISHTMDIKAMADTGAQCSIFTFGAIRSLGVEPLGLKQSDVSIVGVGGKPLDSIV